MASSGSRAAHGGSPRGGPRPRPEFRLARGVFAYHPRVFLALSNALGWLAAPLSWALVLAAIAVLLHGRRPRAARALGLAAAAIVVAFSLEPVANALQRACERGVRSTYRRDLVYDAVIVLSGQVDYGASRKSGETEFDAAADRVIRAMELMRAERARYVLLSGDTARPRKGDVPEADRLAAKLGQWGVPPDRILVDASSRNTRENAIQSARIAAARGLKRLLLVTSAMHVPRALGCFRAVGLDPDVLPVDHRATDGRGEPWLPRAASLSKSTFALHELVGRAVYWAAGYTR